MGSNVLVAAFKDLSSGAFGVALDIIITQVETMWKLSRVLPEYEQPF